MDKIPDPLFIASGRLSHAIRTGEEDYVIMQRRRELVGAQLERVVTRILEAGIGPTEEQCQNICDMITSATKVHAAA